MILVINLGDFQQDDFYILKKNSVKKTREFLQWAKNNSLLVNLYMHEGTRVSSAPSDKAFDELLGLVSGKNLSFLRVALRKQMNLYLLLTNHLCRKDILEVALPHMPVGNKTYFISILLNKKHLPGLKKKYDLKQIGGTQRRLPPGNKAKRYPKKVGRIGSKNPRQTKQKRKFI